MTAVDNVAAATVSEAERLSHPRWARPAVLVLLAVSALVYLWGLHAAGWANDYYAAAVEAGTQNWTAMLFGSLDPGNAITVDKPPAALWVMALSGRVFGFSTLSMLVPQALMGVASVGLLYAAVRRVSGPAAGLISGAVLAATPVAALMFRFNNPDALLVLLLVASAYCVVRALYASQTRWIALAGVLIGFAFLAKLLQALLVTPALALVVIVALPGGVWVRMRILVIGVVTTVVSAGWFLVLGTLWPARSRPYIGGSTNNSLLQLALGYNGLGRVFGGDGNPGGAGGFGPPGASVMFGGQAGVTRLFGESMGNEISWLLPAALVGMLAGLWSTRHAPRTSPYRVALLLWGGWMMVTATVFSLMKGIIHPYYTVALAPAIAALVGMAVTDLWRDRVSLWPRIALALMLSATAVWNFILLGRASDWLPWLRWVILIAAIALSAVLAIRLQRLSRAAATALAATGLVLGLASTTASTVDTVVASGHSGPIPTSSPHSSTMNFGPGGPGGPGAPGGPLSRAADNAQLKSMITAAHNHWAAATVGSPTAADLELATGTSVMSVGGFTGSDPAPTLQQFQGYVAQHQIRYFIVSNGPADGPKPDGTPTTSTQITNWVQHTFSARDIGGIQVYDLAAQH
ncbi:ArnT family glycosyltransferase [Mycobacterium sp. M23085]|uniref:ArnT family glycosyltransferase n=1 Tax=Mycobacterium sp. M23085 TaxID=3378087 RepID=UPI0038779885